MSTPRESRVEHPPTAPQRPQRLFDFASIGWVLLLSALLMLFIVWRLLVPHFRTHLQQVGNGRDLDTYHYDLSTCLVPREQLTPSMPKDYLPALTSPAVLAGADVEAFNKVQRDRYHRKFLVSGDRVIGLSLGGLARAYPLNVLNWHEVVNDELGSVPVCVTYTPLCDSAVVFDRRVGAETLELGVSGLLYNSNLLMYDRRPGAHGESLWSQLQFRAVAGPAAAAGASLTVLPLQLTHWSDWLARHPDTTVIAGDQTKLDRYNTDPYSSYLQLGKQRFPVSPEPPPGGSPPFSYVLALQGEDGWRVFPYDEIESHTGQSGAWTSGPLTLHYLPVAPGSDYPCAWAEWQGVEPQYSSVSCLWFAWHAMHPDLTAPGPR